jgi:hypothetical protein
MSCRSLLSFKVLSGWLRASLESFMLYMSSSDTCLNQKRVSNKQVIINALAFFLEVPCTSSLWHHGVLP